METKEKGVVTPQETEPDLLVTVWESLAEAWVDSGVGLIAVGVLTVVVLGGVACWYKFFWRRLKFALS